MEDVLGGLGGFQAEFVLEVEISAKGISAVQRKGLLFIIFMFGVVCVGYPVTDFNFGAFPCFIPLPFSFVSNKITSPREECTKHGYRSKR